MRRRRLAGLAVSLLLVTVAGLRGQSAGDNPHGSLQIDCGECHNPERWTPVDKPPTFRHGSTGFALDSAHGRASCRACHRTLAFNQVGTACADCHKDSHRGELGARCEACHTPTTWTNQREMFQVHDRSRFPLFVSHARLDCTACHRGQNPYQYANTPAECGNCHLPTYLATTNPSHVQGGFSRRCEDCHNVTSPTWRSAAFEHPARFPLAGGHAGVVCARCHTGGNYAGTSPQCASCHQKDYAAATNPNHAASGFPQQCENCHTIQSWRPAIFDHSQTRFALTGAHTRTDCAKCHPGGRYTGTPSDCYSCHQANYAATTNPNHAASRFSTQCTDCHNTGAWRPANFDHNKTRFALNGAHERTDCAKCHPGGRYTGTPTRLLLVPPGEVHGDHEPEPRRLRLRDDVPDLPQHERVEAGDLRPQQDPLRADRRPHPHRLREVPRRRALRRHVDRLLLLPPGEVRRHHQPEPRRLRLPDAVPELPQHERLAAGELQPQRDEVPADRRAHVGRLREVPRGRPLHRHADRLLLLPPGEVHGHHESRTTRGPASRPSARPATTRARGGPRPSTTTAATSRSTRGPTAASGRAAASATSTRRITGRSSASSATNTRTREKWTTSTGP